MEVVQQVSPTNRGNCEYSISVMQHWEEDCKIKTVWHRPIATEKANYNLCF